PRRRGGPAVAGEDRGRPQAAEADPYGARRRLPARPGVGRMRHRAVPSGGLRRRLTIAFTLAVGISAAALAPGWYLVVRHNLLADSVDSNAAQVRRNLTVAPTYLAQSPTDLLAAYARSGSDFLTVGVRGGRPFSSSFSVGLRQVPESLRRLVRQG